jgi:hypothetical protein
MKKTNIHLPVNKSTMYLTSNIVQTDLEKSDTHSEDLHLLREYVVSRLTVDTVVGG